MMFKAIWPVDYRENDSSTFIIDDVRNPLSLIITVAYVSVGAAPADGQQAPIRLSLDGQSTYCYTSGLYGSSCRPYRLSSTHVTLEQSSARAHM